MNPEPAMIPATAIAALEAGRKIEAIKRTRAETGMPLKESTDAVEHYIASVPALVEKFDQRGRWPWVLLVLALLAFGIFASGLLG